VSKQTIALAIASSAVALLYAGFLQNHPPTPPDPESWAVFAASTLTFLLATAALVGTGWMVRASLREERIGEVVLWSVLTPWLLLVMGHAFMLATPKRDAIGVEVTPINEGLPSPPPRVVLLRRAPDGKSLLAMSEDRALWHRDQKQARWRELGVTVPKDFIDVALHQGSVHVLEGRMHAKRYDLSGELLLSQDLNAILIDYHCALIQREVPEYADFPCDRLRREGPIDFQRVARTPWTHDTAWLTIWNRQERHSFCGFELLSLNVLRVRVDQSSVKIHYCPEEPDDATFSLIWDATSQKWKLSEARGTRIIERFRQPQRAESGPCSVEGIWDHRNYHRAFYLLSTQNKRDRDRVEVTGPQLWLDNGDMIDMGLSQMRYHRIDETCRLQEILPLDVPGLPVVSDSPEAHPTKHHPRHNALLFDRETTEDTVALTFAPASGGVSSAHASLLDDKDPCTAWRARATRMSMKLEQKRPARRFRYLRVLLFTFHLIGWILLGKRLWKRRSPERGE